ncbi:MAG: PH domain-containing protein [Firmicutes bacterium]|nr:PH domain-containing protein [Bacillota bacterium]
MAKKDDDINYIWKDKKRILGLPISFTRYAMNDDRLFYSKGLFTTEEKEIMLYRVRDISLKLTLFQKLFGVGSIHLYSSDTDLKNFEIRNIKNPRKVKELIHRQVELKKEEKGINITEFIDDGPAVPHHGAPKK